MKYPYAAAKPDQKFQRQHQKTECQGVCLAQQDLPNRLIAPIKWKTLDQELDCGRKRADLNGSTGKEQDQRRREGGQRRRLFIYKGKAGNDITGAIHGSQAPKENRNGKEETNICNQRKIDPKRPHT